MNKQNILIALVIGGAVVYLFARFFNLIGYYNIATPSMSPNYEVGKIVFASNLKQADYNDVVAYIRTSLPEERMAEAGDIYISRIMGKGGDEIEIKDGIFYLNKKIKDDVKTLLPYKIATAQYHQLHERLRPKEELYFVNNTSDFTILYLSEKEKEAIIEYANLEELDVDRPIYGVFKDRNWTLKDFGEVEVPKDHFFLLSDNRYNAVDSRTHGFIHKNKLVGVVLN